MHLYTGQGKGKTTAAIGLTIRALGAGWKVAMIQFDKAREDTDASYSERTILRELKDLDLYPFGANRILGPGKFRFTNTDEDREEARQGFLTAERLLKEGRYDLLILDEMISAVQSGLITSADVMRLIDLYHQDRKCELVMTGRGAWPELEERADLVTDMRKVKHYFDQKEPPKKGIEY